MRHSSRRWSGLRRNSMAAMNWLGRLACLLAILPTASAAGLAIATGAVDITGPIGYPMGGYGARKGVSQAVHDPLLAKILLIRSGARQFAIATYDLVAITSSRV